MSGGVISVLDDHLSHLQSNYNGGTSKDLTEGGYRTALKVRADTLALLENVDALVREAVSLPGYEALPPEFRAAVGKTAHAFARVKP